jgi:hypothetical protein
MISAARTNDQPAAVRHLQVVPADRPDTVAVPPGLIALFRIPFQIAVTGDVWADVVRWSHPSDTGHRHQSEEARLTDLLWMVTVAAAQPITPGRARRFSMWRVPNTAPGSLPRRVRLTLTLDTPRRQPPAGGRHHRRRPSPSPVGPVASHPRRHPRSGRGRLGDVRRADPDPHPGRWSVMGSWVNICPGCSGRFRDDEAFIWHTEVCDEYAALPVEGDQ